MNYESCKMYVHCTRMKFFSTVCVWDDVDDDDYVCYGVECFKAYYKSTQISDS